MKMPIGFITDMEFIWGFQTRVAGLSKTSPSFQYPPPSVILGSIAESIAKKNGVGENKGKMLIPALSRELLAIGLKPLNCCPVRYQTLGRIIAIRESGGVEYPNPKYISKSFDAPARGYTVLSTCDGDTPKIRIFTVFKSNTINLYGDQFNISKDDFWRIHRLGSKESIVSILDVVEIDNREIKQEKNKVIVTTYSFPVDEELNVEPIEVMGKWEDEIYINPYKIESYDERENPITNYMLGRKIIKFKVPIISIAMPFSTPICKVKIHGRSSAYTYGDEVVIGYG